MNDVRLPSSAPPSSAPAGDGIPDAPGAPPVTPLRIVDALGGYQALFVLSTALDLRLFAHVAAGADTQSALETATGASRRGLRMLLNALVALGFLSRTASDPTARYTLAPDAARFLVDDAPGYMGGYVQFTARHIVDPWRDLTACVRSGTPSVALDAPDEGVDFWGELVDLLAPWNRPMADAMGAELRRRHPDASRLLDVAAGSGVWGLAAARAHPDLHVVAVDLPGVLLRAEANVADAGLTHRFSFRAGNVRTLTFENAAYDVAVLGQICHSEGPVHSARLIQSVGRALRPGGTLAVVDMLLDEDRAGPLFTVLYALTMLVSTTEGDTFTRSTYERWLRDAGFDAIERFEAAGQSALLARRM